MSASRLKLQPLVDAHALKQALDERSVILIDVREFVEFEGEHIAGATLLPLSQFNPCKVPQVKSMQLVLYCRSGKRSTTAVAKLQEAGFENVLQLADGIGGWKQAGYPTIQKKVLAKLPHNQGSQD